MAKITENYAKIYSFAVLPSPGCDVSTITPASTTKHKYSPNIQPRILVVMICNGISIVLQSHPTLTKDVGDL